MSFQQRLERNLNRNMKRDDPQAGSSGLDISAVEEKDIQKQSMMPASDEEVEDMEFSEKKDHPPRFSTLFEPTSKPGAVDYSRPAKRRSGVFVSMPVLIICVVAFFLESTLLFTYTIIGLYNNAPASLVGFGGPPSASLGASCNCQDKPPSVNIAPNFVMPQAQQAPPVTITVYNSAMPPNAMHMPTTTTTTTSSSTSTTSSTSSSTSSTTSSSSTSTINVSSQAAIVASDVMSIISTLLPSSTSTSSSSSSSSTSTSTSISNSVSDVATSTDVSSAVPTPPSTVNSVQIITVDPAGSTIPPRSTVTSVTVVPGSTVTAGAVRSAAEEASVQSGLAAISTALNPALLPPPPSTLMTSASPSVTSQTPSTFPSTPLPSPSSATGMPCFGGSGAAELDCPASL